MFCVYIAARADLSGNGFSFASWSILADHKQGLFKQLTSFSPFFRSGEDVFIAFSTFLSVLGSDISKLPTLREKRKSRLQANNVLPKEKHFCLKHPISLECMAGVSIVSCL